MDGSLEIKKIKISIITAIYNSAANITGCIVSVNKQTYPDMEHNIIDGASKDNTLEIINSLPNLHYPSFATRGKLPVVYNDIFYRKRI